MHHLRNRTLITWFPKLAGLLIATIYFVAITLVHDSPYVWLSLTLVVILCLTTFACRSDKPILRFSRPRESNAQEDVPQTPQIWTTDVPPSYSFIMENQSIAPSVLLSQPGSPGTPPPTYGSVFKFPAPNQIIKTKETSITSPLMLRQVLGKNLFLSVSRQVSFENQLEKENPMQITRQNSETSIGDDISGIIIVCKPQRMMTSSLNSQNPAISSTNAPHSAPHSNECSATSSVETKESQKD
ncbi:uncharacterized protein LOC106666252 isoform X2 [Cimex lectularius]|uniref:Uncharacterized protein n=1 Tax=Cimex lectularius TaxID=79782 RepID=A0A8I6RP22_CIMLE|nr:uncharacterized protein LOC106666252 isoform X2 [Cimex lectularius]